MKVLFIGGTGRLSKDTAALAVERGMDVTLLTRGSASRSLFVTKGCEAIRGDIRKPDECRTALAGREFDVVVDYLTFNVSQLEATLGVIEGKCAQYVFVSSATVYEMGPEGNLSISEEHTPAANGLWDYSWNKHLCEELLATRRAEGAGPQYTIVRPYVTYGNTRIPYPLVPQDNAREWSFAERIRLGLPIPTFDAGSTPTTLTHTRDFAKGMVGLFGNEDAYGEAYHITSDEPVTWGMVVDCLEEALGAEAVRVDVARDRIYRELPEYRAIVEGDKGRPTRFDDSKIKGAVPDFSCDVTLEDGIADMVAFHESHPELKRIDWEWMGKMDRLLLSREEIKTARAQYEFRRAKDKLRYELGLHAALGKLARAPKRLFR